MFLFSLWWERTRCFVEKTVHQRMSKTTWGHPVISASLAVVQMKLSLYDHLVDVNGCILRIASQNTNGSPPRESFSTKQEISRTRYNPRFLLSILSLVNISTLGMVLMYHFIANHSKTGLFGIAKFRILRQIKNLRLHVIIPVMHCVTPKRLCTVFRVIWICI